VADGTYAWYGIASGEDLRQGDVLTGCPVVIPKVTATGELDTEVGVETHDVVVLTQSCDLENNKVDVVLVCPLWSLEDLGNADGHFKTDKGKEDLRRRGQKDSPPGSTHPGTRG
jgi:hypothetical protein